jgi:H+/Cl- antiporter ClcA
MLIIVAASILGGLAAVLFAKLCDASIVFHRTVIQQASLLSYALLPVGFVLCAWLVRRIAPAAAGSGIPQVIAASEARAGASRQDPRVSLLTALMKVLGTALMLVCGAAVGREGPTVQVVAAIMFAVCAHLRGGPSRRALLVAGGAAGVAAAFNTLIAGVVFAVEELAKGFDRRTNAIVILVVVVAGAASYALAGDYAYFGDLSGVTAVAPAWMLAPVMGVACGGAGGLFARCLAGVIGPRANFVGVWRGAHPLVFAGLCGLAASGAAWASGGLSFGAGYEATRQLLISPDVGGVWTAVWRWVATFAASASGAAGGLFAPSLAVGAAIGSTVHELFPALGGRELIVLGMAAYLAGVVQAPLTSAVILMEMTRDPALVGPLMLSTLVARAVSSRIMREPLYHVLAGSWRERRAPEPAPL